MNDPATTPYLTADRDCLMALLTALLADESIPPLAARVLEDHLGLGWAREFSFTRSREEREECIVRRLRLHRPVRLAKERAQTPPYAERIDVVTSHEDGGAR